ncbi:hypothetical protein GJ496_008901 [Pomphorhynchus laevis]|nr:hypothetical protein GJ496_008901 [Pomphorhynchus laevis]
MSIKLAAIIALSILRIIQTQSVDESVPLTDEKTVPKIKENEQNDDFKIRSSLLDGLSDDELSKISNSTKSQVFHTEQDRLMKLIINSLYKNKEIFLRELISNGCDAIDKTRRESLTNSNIKDASDSSLFIRIKVDKDNNMIHVTDTGIGMTSDHLRDYLGTIAKSQTSEFLKTFAEGNESQDPNSMNDLIGQFGVGFYSSFLVADKIIVTSKHDDDDQYIWESDSKQFKIMKDPRGNTLNRGTTVSLHLKEEASEYLDLYKLRNIISKYSQFVRSPIYLWNHKEIEEDDIDEEVADDDVSEGKKDEDTKDKTSGGADDKDSGIDDDVKVSEEEVESSKHKKQKSAKKVKQTVWYWDHVNDVEPIWQRRPSEINNAEYVEFYKALVKRNETPLNYVHFSAEGDVNFRSIVYLPKASIPVYASSLNKANSDNIKLYVRRVFISEQADLLPSYLNFVRGIVDSDDLSLNISREELQQSKFLKTIRKKLIRKILDTLKSLNESEYIDFWKEFGTNMKFGVTEDSLNRLRLANLLRFYSSYSTMDGKRNFTSLNDYVQRARKNQKTIYYVSLPSLDNSKISPFVEKLIKKGYEVLYLVDPVDQFCLQNIPEFKNMKFQNAAKEGLDLKTSEKAKKQLEEIENEYQPLTRWMEEAFSDRIIKVILSQRLVETPMVFVASQWGYDGNMERISKAQAYQKVGGDSATVHFANMKRKLEINPKHPLIKDLLRRVKDDKSDPEFREIAEVCVDTAMIRSGYELRDPLKFTDRIEAILRQVMKIPVKQSMDFADEEDDDELADISETTSSKKDDSEDLADESITNKNKDRSHHTHEEL